MTQIAGTPIDGDEELANDLPASLMRQPVLDGERAVHGYELFDRSPSGDGMLDALAHSGTLALAGRKLLFMHVPHARLLDPVLHEIPTPGIVLEIEGTAGDQPEDIAALVPLLEALGKRGFQFCFAQSVLKKAYAAWLPHAAFVKLDLAYIKADKLEALANFARGQTTARLIASSVATPETFERMFSLGVRLFQGDWFARPAPVKARSLRPSQAVVIQLINLLRAEADTADVEQLLKRDPSLSFNLLRFINTSGMGLSCEVTSLRHAVMILGQQRLFRWAALLMTMSRAGGTAPAVATTAIVRGRLMELLGAELLPAEDCDNAFVVGVFSLLGLMLNMSLEDALATIALPEAVGDALLRREGVFAPFLALTEACESGDEQAFARAATELQLSNRQVNWAHLQALVWAEELALGL